MANKLIDDCMKLGFAMMRSARTTRPISERLRKGYGKANAVRE